MSRDIFVQDLPKDARTVADVPDDFQPQPIGTSARVIDAVRRVAPDADLSDPTWGRIDRPGYSIEVNVPSGDNISGFALHVRGDGADELITSLLVDLGLRALDSWSEAGEILPRAQADVLDPAPT